MSQSDRPEHPGARPTGTDGVRHPATGDTTR